MTDDTRRSCSYTAGATGCNVSLNPHAEEFIPCSSARASVTSQLAPSLASNTDSKALATVKTSGEGGISASRRTGGRGGRNNRKHKRGGVSRTERGRGRSARCGGQVDADVQEAAATAAAAPTAANSTVGRRDIARTPKDIMPRDVTQEHSSTNIYRADGLHGHITTAAVKSDSRNSRGSASSTRIAQERKPRSRHGTMRVDSTRQPGSVATPTAAASGSRRRRQASSKRNSTGDGSVAASEQRLSHFTSARSPYSSEAATSLAGKSVVGGKSGRKVLPSTQMKPAPRTRQSGGDATYGESELVDGEKKVSSATSAYHPVVDLVEEAFPALSTTTRSRAPQTRALDYSSLAEGLAAEAAITSVSVGLPETKPSDADYLRLSVLPCFGEREHGPEQSTADGMENALDANCESEPSQNGAPGRKLKPHQRYDEGVLLGDVSPPPLPPPPPPTASIITLKERSSRATAASGTLGDTLRARWFRLEAARRAERQREEAEREVMAMEDCAVSEGRVDDNARGLSEQAGIKGSHNGSDGEPEYSSCESDEEENTYHVKDKGGAEEKSHMSVITTSASTECQVSTNDSVKSAAHASVLHSRPRRATISAAGVAAIRRSQQAPAEVPRPSKTNEWSTTASGTIIKQRCNDGAVDVICSTNVQSHEQDRDATRESNDQGLETAERIHEACQLGQAGLLNNLLVRSAGRAADERDKIRRTPLHLAAEAGALECVVLLLKQGTRLDQRDKWRETPLHKAARLGSAEVVKALCAARMKVNVRNRHRETPLLLAVRSDSLDTVSVLLSYGARLNDPDVHGVSPVCQAAMSGQSELLMAMVNSNQACRKSSRDSGVEHYATTSLMLDPSSLHPAASSRGYSGSDSARPKWSSAGSSRQADRVGKCRLPSAVDGSGAPLFCSSNRGAKGSTGGQAGKGSGGVLIVPELSAIHEAAGAGQAETLSLLMDLGVKFDECDMKAVGGQGRFVGDTPLGRAVRAGRLDCARILLDAGAAIDGMNLACQSPMTIAILADKASAVEFLLQRGALLNDGGGTGRTSAEDRRPILIYDPLELALRKGHLSCAAALVEGGAHITPRALQGVKLEASQPAAVNRPADSGTRLRYAGGGLFGTGYATDTNSPPVAGATTLSFKADILDQMSSELVEMEESASGNGGEVLLDSEQIQAALQMRYDPHGSSDGEASAVGQDTRIARTVAAGMTAGVPASNGRSITSDNKERNHVRVGGLLAGLGECDVVLVLADGCRLPVHACLLAAFSGTFRDLFLPAPGARRHRHRDCPDCLSIDCRCYPRCRHHDSSGHGTVADTEPKPLTSALTPTCGDVGGASSNSRISATGGDMSTNVEPVVDETCGNETVHGTKNVGGDGDLDESSRNASRSINSSVQSRESEMPLVRPVSPDIRKVAPEDENGRTQAGAKNDTVGAAHSALSGEVPATPKSANQEEWRSRVDAVYALLVEENEKKFGLATAKARSTESKNLCVTPTTLTGSCDEEGDIAARNAATAAAAAAAALALRGPAGVGAVREPSAAMGWGTARGEVWVRFWGPKVMTAIVRHCYCGRPPSGVHHPAELAKILVAAALFRMTRLMRQVEALLFATLVQQPKSKKLTDHCRAGTMLRAARALGAVDLESRCTLLLQANGTLREVMKLRKELGIPSLNLSDVSGGLDRLNGKGYLGSGPAHAWSSTAIPGSGVAEGAAVRAATAAAKRTVDLSFRKRAVEFDQLVPLLLDPTRCSSALSIGRRERILLLKAAMDEACRGWPSPTSTSIGLGGRKGSSVHDDLIPRHHHSRKASWCCADGGIVAVPAASNFAAFSHGVSWLLSSGVAADVALILTLPSSEIGDQAHQQQASDMLQMQNGDSMYDGHANAQLQPQAPSSPRETDRHGEGAAPTARSRFVFLAHSVVLGARSEKFAAMLRFVRMQDDARGCVSDDGDNGSDKSGSYNSVSDGHDDENQEEVVRRDNTSPDGDATDPHLVSLKSEEAMSVTRAGRRQPLTIQGLEGDQRHPEVLAVTSERSTSSDMSSCSFYGCYGAAAVRWDDCTRPVTVRDRVPRELELHSPLLSPRSLGLFLEFCYTGVLDPSLSVAELSELALLADEYLTPDLTQQVEIILVEILNSQEAESWHTESEAAASTVLELLQLGVTLGLGDLSAAAARAVLLHLPAVCTSGVFASCGMTKRELVVAALEAV